MNARRVTMTAAALSVGLFTLEAPVLAHSEDLNCHEVRGNLVEVFNPENNTNTGRLSRGGWLDGTTVSVFNSAAFPSPDPDKVTFSSTFALTTDQGQLKGIRRVYLFDLVTGLGVAMTDIDSTASTGLFAGATGVLYQNIVKSITVAGPYHELVGGKICFARHDGDER